MRTPNIVLTTASFFLKGGKRYSNILGEKRAINTRFAVERRRLPTGRFTATAVHFLCPPTYLTVLFFLLITGRFLGVKTSFLRCLLRRSPPPIWREEVKTSFLRCLLRRSPPPIWRGKVKIYLLRCLSMIFYLLPTRLQRDLLL